MKWRKGSVKHSHEAMTSLDDSLKTEYAVKHRKCKKHIWQMGAIAAVSLFWLLIRTGGKPSRIAYPCQRAAVANIHIFLLAMFAPILNFGKIKATLPDALNNRSTKTVMLISCLLLAFGSVALTSKYTVPESNFTFVPLNLTNHSAISSVNPSDLFFVENASGVEGNMDGAVSTLLQVMADHGLFFFKTADQPSGLIGKDDVIIIKVNSQWSQRGGTNTDLVKSVINKIVSHPEGFTGEIVIADDGQWQGSLAWYYSNAFNHTQSMTTVANSFSSYKVSTYLWDRIVSRAVKEYDQGDFTDGYVVNMTENPISHFRVSYPKFRTKYGTYISFRNGIWNNATGSYHSEKLKVINVPVLKSHQIYGVTACVKHYMGVLSNSLTNGHGAIRYGAMGTEMGETRFPTLNILDAIWVNANPIESGVDACGPETFYEAASYTNVISTSQDPVALDYWASKHILMPAAVAKGYTAYSSLDPDYEPVTRPLAESFHNYLERSMDELRRMGFQVTMSEDEMNVYGSVTLAPVHNVNSDLRYGTIQAAIDADETVNGHTVFVGAGTYYEHILIDKSITLRGENDFNTIIDGNETGSVVTVIADNVEISGFTIRRAGFTPSSSDSGIYINSSNNIITDNNVVTNENCGIWLDSHSSNNTVVNNHIEKNSKGCTLKNATGNVLAGNDITTNVEDGLSLWNSSNNIVSDNNVSNNLRGVSLVWSNGNELIENDIVNNAEGISLDQSGDNRVYHNSFLNNTESQVYLSTNVGNNSWDDNYPSGGNYWSDFNPADANRDKIGDSPYTLNENNVDRYPLTYPFEFYRPEFVPPSDLNKDGTVNIVDMAIVAKAFGSRPNIPGWNAVADMDINEVINIVDVAKVAKSFGK